MKEPNRRHLNAILCSVLIVCCLGCLGVKKEAIHEAAAEGNIQKMTELVNAGVDVNQPDSMGDTPLQYALMKSQFKSAKWLAERGGTIDYKDKRDTYPRDFLTKDPETARWIEENLGPDPRKK